MKKYIVHGPTDLSGTINVQYSKNIAMKLVLFPLLHPGRYTLKKIPHITSITNLINILELYGCKSVWDDENSLQIDSTNLKEEILIPEDIFSHTSAGIGAIQIMVNRHGKSRFGKSDMDNIGGDKIGSRDLYQMQASQKEFGVEVSFQKDTVTFQLKDREGFEYNVPGNSYGGSVGALYNAILRKSPSLIYDVTGHPDFNVIIKQLTNLGANLSIQDGNLEVKPLTSLDDKVEIENTYDLNDFMTLLVAGIVTESSIDIVGYDREQMAGDVFEDYLERLGVKYQISNYTFHLDKNKISDLKPIDIVSSTLPLFNTDWQPLISPLLALIPGNSIVSDIWYDDRLAHWHQLGKLGAKYQMIFHQKAKDEKPIAVRVSGVEALYGDEVISENVRSGACLLIAGLVANGKTVISGIEHVERGYERLPERLNEIGAMIDIVEN